MNQRLRSEQVAADLMRAADPLDAAWVAAHAAVEMPTVPPDDEMSVAHSPHRRSARWSQVGAIAVVVAAVVALAVSLNRHGTTRTNTPPIATAPACDPHGPGAAAHDTRRGDGRRVHLHRKVFMQHQRAPACPVACRS